MGDCGMDAAYQNATRILHPALAKDGDKRWELSSSAFGKIVIWFFSLLLAFAAIGYWQNMGRK